MKEKINKFYKGDFIYSRPKLIVSENDIKFTISRGSIYKGYFTISNDKNTKIKGILVSSCPLIILGTREFSSTHTRVDFKFDATHLEINKSYNEHIQIISDCGEYRVNISAHIVRPYFNSKIGKVMDLTRFTYLAKFNWDQALEIFASEEFPEYILSKDDKYIFLRKHLLKSRSLNHGLEEFLVAINQKHPAKLSVSQDKLNYHIEEGPIGDKLLLSMDNWGHIDTKITSDSSFIYIEKNSVTNKSFIGKSYFLELIILPDKMHKGNNYGRIYITTTYETIVIELTASYYGESQPVEKRANLAKFKAYQVDLTNLHLEYSLSKVSKSDYIKSLKTIVFAMKGLVDQERDDQKIDDYINDYLSLFLIYLANIEGEEEKSQALFDKLKARAKEWKASNNRLYWVFTTLKAAYSTQVEGPAIINDIERYYFAEGRYNSQVLLSLISLKSKHFENNKIILKEIRNHFLNGQTSPYLYREALRILNDNPHYLTSLTGFVVQVINFGVKVNGVSIELANQFVYLAAREKHYSYLIFKALALLYTKFESLDTLNAICSLLIKGNKHSRAYHSWYKLGVLANLRIAELYEYFMYSLDEEEDQVLPTNLLYYFSYSNTLNVEKWSYLYAYIINNKYQIPDLYEAYLPNMERFAYEQGGAGRINSYLSEVYGHIFSDSKVRQDKGSLLWNVAFRHDIKCDNPNIKGVLVVHRELEKTSYKPLNKGYVQVDLYNEDGEIFLIDYNDNLYYKDISYDKRQLFDVESHMLAQPSKNMDNPNHLIYLTYNIPKYRVYRQEKANKHYKKLNEVRKQVLDHPGEITKEFYIENLIAIIGYYYKYSKFMMVDKYLEILDYIPDKLKDKYKLMELLIDRRFYKKAFLEIEKYGIWQIADSRLYGLCDYLVGQELDSLEDRESLLALSYYCFTKDKQDINTLKYLVNNYQGKLEELYEIWQVARTYKLNTREIEKRLLTQALFTEGEVENIFDIYKSYSSDGRNETMAILSKSLLNYKGYEYLVKEVEIDKRFFLCMETFLKAEKSDICILALLRHYARLASLDQDQIKFVHRFLDEYIKKGIVLEFFKNFKDYVSIPYDFIYKTYVEVKADPGSKVTIKYSKIDLSQGEEIIEDKAYSTSEEMDHIFAGIFTRGFLIFYNERIEYTISIESPDGQIISLEESSLGLDQDMELNEDNIYNQINFMKLARDTGDGEAFIDSYNKISKMDYILSKVFKPL